MTTSLLNKACLICDASLKQGKGIFVPEQQVGFVYAKLMEAGMKESAVKFLQVNVASCKSYCIKCWISNHTMIVMLDEELTDENRVAIINQHIAATVTTIGASGFWDAIGNPELN